MNVETACFCSYIDKRENVVWGYIKTASPEMSRNGLIEDHLRNDKNWTHVLFVDSDVAPPLYALDKLLETGSPVATGIYPLYLADGMYWNISIDGERWLPMHEELPSYSEPFEVRACGAGILLVKKEVVTDIGWPYFKMVYQPKYENKGSAIKTGEDVWFCKKATEKGHKIMAHPLVECGHYNSVELREIYETIKLQVKTNYAKDKKV